jgi:hypothetical protein
VYKCLRLITPEEGVFWFPCLVRICQYNKFDNHKPSEAAAAGQSAGASPGALPRGGGGGGLALDAQEQGAGAEDACEASFHASRFHDSHFFTSIGRRGKGGVTTGGVTRGGVERGGVERRENGRREQGEA